MSKENSIKFALNSQYVKDLSFENPHAPASIPKIAQNPHISFNVDIKAGKLKDDFYEVTLNITARADEEKDSDSTIFIVELNYAGVFTITGVNEETVKPILLVECPTLLFPFARRIIADATRDGGFPPLVMEPINFANFLENNKDKVQTS